MGNTAAEFVDAFVPKKHVPPYTTWEYEWDKTKVILRSDGFFAAVGPEGNYVYLWTNHGEDDFRKFFLRVKEDYLIYALGMRLDEIHNTVRFVKRVITGMLVPAIKRQLKEDNGEST